MNLGRVGISYKERLKIFLSWLSFDSGIRSGLDLIRALALGADFVLLGRAFVYGVCALGSDEAYHAYQILQEELINNMKQLGGTSLAELERVII